MPLLSVIIVNYNTRQYLLNSLQSLYATTSGIDMEVWVVDNASQDGSIETVEEQFPQVKLIKNRVNKGFAAGCNSALRMVSSAYVLILNTDTILKPGAINYFLDFLQTRVDVGMVGGQLLNPDESKQNAFDNFPSLLTELTNKSLLRLLFPRIYPSKYRLYEEPLEVESVIGACMLVRTEAIQQVGLLDEDYFFFLEETDWCFRLRKGGWRIYYLPMAQIVHFQGQSAQLHLAKARVEYYRSRYLFFRRHRGRFQLILLAVMLFFRLIFNTLFTGLLNLLTLFRFPHYRKKMAIYWHLLFWHLRFCPPSMGLKPTGNRGAPPGFSSRYLGDAGTKWFIRQDLSLVSTKETYEALDALIAGRVGSTIQDRRIRRIVKGNLPTLSLPVSVYLKTYRLPEWIDRFKYLFRHSKARKEAEVALEIRSREIATISPLAFGERYEGGILQENYLISEEIKDARSLDILFLQKGGKIELKEEAALTRQVAQLVRKVHQEGIYHTDFHAGNILVIDNGVGGRYQLFLMDLHHVRIMKRGLSLNKKLHNLVQLNQFFFQRLRASARFRFLKAYCQGMGEMENSIASYARLIECRTRKASGKLYRRRGKRCLRNNNDFMVFDNGSYRGYLRRDNSIKKEIPSLINNLDNLKIIKENKKSTLFLTNITSGNGLENIYIKRYQDLGLLGFLKGFMRPSRAITAWRMAHAVLVRDFNTALPLGAIEDRYLGFLQKSIYMSKEVPAGLGIDWFVLKEFDPDNVSFSEENLRRRRVFISRFAKLIRHWHSLNLYQRDLKASNILVSADSSDQWKFYFIDMEGIRVLRRIKDKHRINNLSQLNTSFIRLKFIGRTDRMRFLKAYLGPPKWKDKPLVRKYWQQIWENTKERLARSDPQNITK